MIPVLNILAGQKITTMKKIFLSICILFAAVTFVSAQGQGGNQQERLAQMKQTLKDSLGLTDEQAQIVLSVQTEFRPKMMELRNVSEGDRATKMKEISVEMDKRLAVLLKDESLAKKVSEFNSRRRRGGNRPQGGSQN